MVVVEVVTRAHPWYTVLPLTTILVYLLTLTGFWQLIFGAGLLAGILMKRPLASFMVGLLGGSVAWGLPLVIASRYYPLEDVATLLLDIIGLPSSLTFLPYAGTVIIAAITTALGALLGAYVYTLVEEIRMEIP
ncbi:MAG: hypothetical protein LN412_08045 [Candidatus Thermoplasmatota archaeon]|nr:hypothetical protein [Candidatus Thermoplasmatota archaeon]